MEDAEPLIAAAEELIRDIEHYGLKSGDEVQAQADAIARVALDCPPDHRDRVRALLIRFIEFGYFDDPLSLDEAIGGPEDVHRAMVRAMHHWRERSEDQALAHVMRARDLDPGDNPRRTAQLGWMAARLSYENNQVAQAHSAFREVLAQDDAPPDEKLRIEVAARAVGVPELTTNGDFLRGVLRAPRADALATVRASTLFQAIECAGHIGAPNEMIELAEAAASVARATGLRFLVFKTQRALANALRTVGRLQRALDALEDVPIVQFGTFDSQGMIASQRGLILVHLGRFDEAHLELARAVESALFRDAEVDAARLLSNRAGIWAYEQRFDLAASAVQRCEEVSPTPVSGIISGIVALARGETDTARACASRLAAAWGEGQNPSARALALGFRAAVERDAELLKVAQETSVLCGPAFVAFVDACTWLVERPTEPPTWLGELGAQPAPSLFGTVSGVAIGGLIRHFVAAGGGLERLEPGLYRIEGSTVDLRRRDSLRNIVETLRATPGRPYDVIDLYLIAWNEEQLPTTYSERMYFAIHELRRLGFRPFIQKSDDGYYWQRRE